MHVDVVRERIRAVPFLPLTVRLADGRSFHVPHPDFIAVSRREVFHVSADDDSIARLAPELIALLDEAPNARPARGSNAKVRFRLA
jgi:hypothetical protein